MDIESFDSTYAGVEVWMNVGATVSESGFLFGKRETVEDCKCLR